MEYKDRLEYPVEFLETMLGNFESPKFQQAQNLTRRLLQIVKAYDTGNLIIWIKDIDFDPESLGSAFYMVYQFAENYLQKITKSKG